MELRLRQICLVAHDLQPVVTALERVFGLAVCHVDPEVGQFGLVNSLLPVGDQFLEVVAPTRPGTAAGRYLDRRQGDGGYMVITQCDDLAHCRRRVHDLGVRIAHTHAYDGFDGIQLHPRDTGGTFFEIDQQQGDHFAADDAWYPAGPDWRPFVRTEVVAAIAEADIQSSDPAALAARWSAISEIGLEDCGHGVPTLPLANARLRFVTASDGRGDGLAALELRARDADRAYTNASRAGLPVDDGVIRLGGMRLRLA